MRCGALIEDTTVAAYSQLAVAEGVRCVAVAFRVAA